MGEIRLEELSDPEAWNEHLPGTLDQQGKQVERQRGANKHRIFRVQFYFIN